MVGSVCIACVSLCSAYLKQVCRCGLLRAPASSAVARLPPACSTRPDLRCCLLVAYSQRRLQVGMQPGK